MDHAAKDVEFRARGVVEEFRPAGDPLAPVAVHLTLRCESPMFPTELRYKALIHQGNQLYELLAENGKRPLIGRIIVLRGLPVPPLAVSRSNPYVEILQATVSLS